MPHLPSDLFRPGDNAIPLHSAGRDPHMQDMISRCELAARVADGGARTDAEKPQVASNIAMMGPRGNGKSVLLLRLRDWAEETWRAERPDAQMLWMGAHEHRGASAEELAAFLAPRSFLRAIAGGLEGWEARAAGFGLKVPNFKRAGRWSLEQAMAARCAAGPAVILIDEAHRLNAETCERMLDASQYLRGQGAPLLLIMAGTPLLEDKLRGTEASYWDRMYQILVGPLTEQEAREALIVPLSRHGVDCSSEDALQVADWAMSGYPFFTQLYGEQVVRALNASGGKAFDLATARRADAEFKIARNVFYARRRDEAHQRGWLPAAAAAGGALMAGRERGKCTRMMVEDAIRPHCPSETSPIHVYDGLRQLDLLWYEGEQVIPGIPSLFSFLVDSGGKGARRAHSEGLQRARQWLVEDAQEAREQGASNTGPTEQQPP